MVVLLIGVHVVMDKGKCLPFLWCHDHGLWLCT